MDCNINFVLFKSITTIMKYTLLFSLLFAISISSCGDDPCETPNNLDCPTADSDMDGVINSEDDEPENPCSPNFPEFEDLVIGTWNWNLSIQTGTVEIKEDGTYEDISSELVSNGDVVSRNWSISGLLKLKFEVENSDGLKASINLQSTSSTCDRIIFDGQGFGDIVFTRQ